MCITLSFKINLIKQAMLSNDDSTQNFTKEENVPLKSDDDTRHRATNNSK